ncbi:MAG: hypothetical protein AAF502_13675 [Bacteroidota bacterium]
MKKDIPVYKVEDVAIAITPEGGNPEAQIWDVYLLNLKDEPILNVLVNSRGYGEIEGDTKKTETLRYFFDDLAGKSYVKIEILNPDLLKLANEYWVSFNLNDYMYDKKYIFVKGSLEASNFTNVPILGEKGVMIK